MTGDGTTEKILITGATGNTGQEVIRLLKQGNSIYVAGLRSPAKDRLSLDNNVDSVALDFENPGSFREALKGITKVFLVRPPAIAKVKKYIYPFIDACKEAGVNHIVFLSLMGVENNKVTPHHKIEKYILQSGIGYTFVRPSFFMQNLSTTHREDIVMNNEIFVPAGKGRTSFIDVRDIAEVAVLALTQPGHINKAYELSGNEALDYYEVAALFSQVLHRKITYTNPSVLRFFKRMRKRGMPVAFVLVIIALYTICKLGLAGKVTSEAERLLGRAPISMIQFIIDHKALWTQSNHQ